MTYLLLSWACFPAIISTVGCGVRRSLRLTRDWQEQGASQSECLFLGWVSSSFSLTPTSPKNTLGVKPAPALLRCPKATLDLPLHSLWASDLAEPHPVTAWPQNQWMQFSLHLARYANSQPRVFKGAQCIVLNGSRRPPIGTHILSQTQQ